MPRAQVIRLDEYRRLNPRRPVAREPGSTFRLIQLFGAPPPRQRTRIPRDRDARFAERRRDPV